jgi:F-type H+-transporting ATPase subunit alpha
MSANPFHASAARPNWQPTAQWRATSSSPTRSFLDEDTRKIIEHGRRIRACLKQPEFAPVSVPAQIAILLALTAKLFDNVPLVQMMDAEHALREVSSDIPAEVRERLNTSDKLSDEDRETIIEIARQALEAFLAVPDSRSEPEQETGERHKPEAKAGFKSRTKPDATKADPQTNVSRKEKS